MPPELDSLMMEWAKTVYPDPQALPPDQQFQLKRAFIAGVWSAMTEASSGNLAHRQAVADSLRNQCQTFFNNVARAAEMTSVVMTADPAAVPAPAAEAETTEFPVVKTDPPAEPAAAPSEPSDTPPAATAGNDEQAPADPPAAA